MDFLLTFDFQCVLSLLVIQTIRLVWSGLEKVYSYSTSVAIVQSSHRYDLMGSWWSAWFCYFPFYCRYLSDRNAVIEVCLDLLCVKLSREWPFPLSFIEWSLRSVV